MKFTVYKAADGWRWRLVATNGRIIADSGEAYTRRHDCESAVTLICEGVMRIQQRRIIDGDLPWA